MRKCELHDHKKDGLIILKILVGTVCDFVQAKSSLYWWIERCDGLIWSCCAHNPQGKAGKGKKKEIAFFKFVPRLKKLFLINHSALNYFFHGIFTGGVGGNFAVVR